MLEALTVNEKIDGALYRELLELNKYMNLIFHGHVLQVESDMAILQLYRRIQRHIESLRGL